MKAPTNKQIATFLTKQFTSARVYVEQHSMIEWPDLDVRMDVWILRIEPKRPQFSTPAFYSVYSHRNDERSLTWHNNFATYEEAKQLALTL